MAGVKVIIQSSMKNIVILISGGGSNMAAIVKASQREHWATKYGARVAAVISNKTDAKTGEGIDQFDANVADISNKTDVSIFVQLSNRYLLNYTKIFKKVEEKPKVETPKKEEGAKK